MRRIVVYPVVGAVVVAGVAWWGVLTLGMPSWPWKGERAAVQTDPNGVRLWIDRESGSYVSRAVRVGDGVFVTSLHALVDDVAAFDGALMHRPRVFVDERGAYQEARVILVAEWLDLATIVTAGVSPGANCFVPIAGVPSVGDEAEAFALSEEGTTSKALLSVVSMDDERPDRERVSLLGRVALGPGDSGGPLYMDGVLWGVIEGGVTQPASDLRIVYGRSVLRHAGRAHRVLADAESLGPLIDEAEAELAMIRMREAMVALSDRLADEAEEQIVSALVVLVRRAIDAEWFSAGEFVEMAWESSTEEDEDSPLYYTPWWRVVVLAAIELGVDEVGGLPIDAAAAVVRGPSVSEGGALRHEALAALDLQQLIEWRVVSEASGFDSGGDGGSIIDLVALNGSLDDVETHIREHPEAASAHPNAVGAAVRVMLAGGRELSDEHRSSIVMVSPQLMGTHRGNIAGWLTHTGDAGLALEVLGWPDSRRALADYSRRELRWLGRALRDVGRIDEFIVLCLELREDGVAGSMEYRPLLVAAETLIDHGHAGVALEALTSISPSAHESYLWLHRLRHRAGADVVGEFRAIGSPLAEWSELRSEE